MKRSTVHLLMSILVLTSLVASPAVMAWTMPAQNSASDCPLCQADPHSQQHSTAAGTTCATAICGMTADINDHAFSFTPAPRVEPAFRLKAHSGRQLDGPEPFPPRNAHA